VAVAGLAAAQAPTGGAPPQGYVATGRAVVFTPGGSLGGPIRIEVWGSRHCRITIDLPGGQRYQRVVNYPGFSEVGPPGVAQALPPGGLGENCDLLTQGLSWGDLASGGALARDLGPSPAEGGDASAGHRYLVYRPAPANFDGSGAARIAKASSVTIDVDGTTGFPERAVFTAATGQTVEDDYSGYRSSGAAPFASRVEQLVNGERRLVVDLDRLAVRPGFTSQDFALPPGPPPRAPRQGER